MESYLLQHWWSGPCLWALVYLSDYYLTIFAAHLHRKYGHQHFAMEGSLELTPVFQKDIDKLNLLSWNFGLAWVSSIAMVAAIATIVDGDPRAYPYLIFFGFLSLVEIPVHLRHIRNIAMFWYFGQSPGVEGKVYYPRWLVLRLSSIDLASFAGLFLLLSLGFHSWLFLGGACRCALLAFKHWSQSREARSKAKPSLSSSPE